jgi:hypothetical protein
MGHGVRRRTNRRAMMLMARQFMVPRFMLPQPEGPTAFRRICGPGLRQQFPN